MIRDLFDFARYGDIYTKLYDQTWSMLKVDRTQFSVASTFDDAERTVYWHCRTPYERLQHLKQNKRASARFKGLDDLEHLL